MALLAPGGAAAATVVNGDFESGNLAGGTSTRRLRCRRLVRLPGAPNPRSAATDLTAPVPAPPQGSYAAITDEVSPDTLILYQDIGLGAGLDHRLSLLAYYDSAGADRDADSGHALGRRRSCSEGQANQQFRIDVMRPDAPLESVDPADILRTVFRTQPGDPEDDVPRPG